MLHAYVHFYSFLSLVITLSCVFVRIKSWLLLFLSGLRMLHNIMKQYRRDFKKIPILRKLLKVCKWEMNQFSCYKLSAFYSSGYTFSHPCLWTDCIPLFFPIVFCMLTIVDLMHLHKIQNELYYSWLMYCAALCTFYFIFIF